MDSAARIESSSPRSAAAYLCSYPKSGRTWLRFTLASYFNRAFQLGIEVDLHTLFSLLPNGGEDPSQERRTFQYADDSRVPLIFSEHAEYSGRFSRERVIFILRNPFDVLVSFYFHQTKHLRVAEADLSGFIRGEDGVARLISYLDSWSGRLSRDRARSLVLTYEGLHADTPKEVARTLAFVGIGADRPTVARAVEDSSFDRMRRLELARGLAGADYPRQDRDARRVRSGKVGGYSEHLSEADLRYIEDRFRGEAGPKTMRLLAEHGVAPRRPRSIIRGGSVRALWRSNPSPRLRADPAVLAPRGPSFDDQTGPAMPPDEARLPLAATARPRRSLAATIFDRLKRSAPRRSSAEPALSGDRNGPQSG